MSTVAGVCEGTATVSAPTFNPAGCADGVTNGLRYRVNGGANVNVPLPPAATVTLNNLPRGTNVITWEVYVIATGTPAGQATQIINVVDLTPPTIVRPT